MTSLSPSPSKTQKSLLTPKHHYDNDNYRNYHSDSSETSNDGDDVEDVSQENVPLRVPLPFSSLSVSVSPSPSLLSCMKTSISTALSLSSRDQKSKNKIISESQKVIDENERKLRKEQKRKKREMRQIHRKDKEKQTEMDIDVISLHTERQKQRENEKVKLSVSTDKDIYRKHIESAKHVENTKTNYTEQSLPSRSSLSPSLSLEKSLDRLDRRIEKLKQNSENKNPEEDEKIKKIILEKEILEQKIQKLKENGENNKFPSTSTSSTSSPLSLHQISSILFPPSHPHGISIHSIRGQFHQNSNKNGTETQFTQMDQFTQRQKISPKDKDNGNNNNHKNNTDTHEDALLSGVREDSLPLPSPSPSLSLSSRPLWMTRGKRVDPSLSLPVSSLSLLSLHPFITYQLQHALRIHSLFPIQSEVIPLLLKIHNMENFDLCCCSATGSGKTLCYVIPIIQNIIKYHYQHDGNFISLSRSPFLPPSHRKLRALIIVPNRDLAHQVKKIFDIFCGENKGKNCKNNENGNQNTNNTKTQRGNQEDKEHTEKHKEHQEDNQHEEEEIHRSESDDDNDDDISLRRDSSPSPSPSLSPLPLRVSLITGQRSLSLEQCSLSSFDVLSGRFFSPTDILICTPGRLIDHLMFTEGFSLEHVEYFVMDEVDKLIGQSFNEWLSIIWKRRTEEKQREEQRFQKGTQEIRRAILPNGNGISNNNSFFSSLVTPQKKSFHQLLFSATLTNNPQKLALLHLNNPIFITEGKGNGMGNTKGNTLHLIEDNETVPSSSSSSSRQFVIPPNLHSFFFVVETEKKPLRLIQILTTLLNTKFPFGENKNNSFPLPPPSIVVFTSSLDSCHRLSHLLTLYGFTSHHEFSSVLSQKERSETLSLFDPKKKFNILLCSDAFARGLDVEHITHVINYDIPSSIQQYIHRVGRTARAGRSGVAVSLVKSHQVHFLYQMMKRAENSFIDKLHFDTWRNKYTQKETEKEDFLSPLSIDSLESEKYDFALSHLRESLEKEKRENLKGKEKHKGKTKNTENDIHNQNNEEEERDWQNILSTQRDKENGGWKGKGKENAQNILSETNPFPSHSSSVSSNKRKERNLPLPLPLPVNPIPTDIFAPSHSNEKVISTAKENKSNDEDCNVIGAKKQRTKK